MKTYIIATDSNQVDFVDFYEDIGCYFEYGIKTYWESCKMYAEPVWKSTNSCVVVTYDVPIDSGVIDKIFKQYLPEASYIITSDEEEVQRHIKSALT